MAETDINYEYFGVVCVLAAKKKKKPKNQQQHISVWWQVYNFAAYIKMTEVRYILCVCVLRKCNIVHCIIWMLVYVFLCKRISRSCRSVSLATSLGQSCCSSTFFCAVDAFLIAFYLDYNKTLSFIGFVVFVLKSFLLLVPLKGRAEGLGIPQNSLFVCGKIARS